MISGFYISKIKTVSFFLLIIFLSFQSLILAQSGSIKGHVFDKETTSPLGGANIIVKSTSLGAAADLNGNYLIRNIPAGRYTFVISYLGYNSDTVVINITADKTIEKDFYLIAKTIEGQTITITAQGQGQISAIQQQLSSDRIVNVISEAKIQELPDFNAAQTISRLPGVSTTQSSGEANKLVIRGLAPQYNEVAIDGMTLASTGSSQIGIASQGGTTGSISNDRSVDLSMVTPYMIKTIELSKELTPDMNANAIGGYVNMELREAPSGIHGDMFWQSGYVAKSSTYGNYRAIASGSDRFFDDQLGVYVLGAAESYDRNSDNMNSTYNIDNIFLGANGYRPVKVNTVTLQRHIETRKRYGGNLILDYQLPSGSFKFVNMFSRLNSQYNNYQTALNYVTGDLGFTYGEGNSNVDLMVNSLNFKNDFGFISVDITAANNYSRNFLPFSPSFSFTQTGGVGKSLVNVTPDGLLNLVNYKGASNTYLTNISLFSSDYKENDQAYKGNFKIPFNLNTELSGFLKFGGEYRYNLHNNSQNTPYASIIGGSAIANAMIAGIRAQYPWLSYDSAAAKFPTNNFTNTNSDINSSFLGNKFGSLLWATDPSLLINITNYIRSTPAFDANNATSINPGGWFDGYFQTLPNTYKYIERDYASYLMSQINFDNLMIVGGIRYEKENDLYQAYNLVDGRDIKSQRYYMVTSYPKNQFWLPMVQSKYQIFDWFDVRYAYTQTLARPDYHQLSPHYYMDYSGNNVWAGNPDLVPAQAYNHDLILTFHSNEIGLLTIGGFYKTVKNFTYSTQYTLNKTAHGGLDTIGSFSIGGVSPKPGAQLYSYVNSRYLAYVKGIEFDFQTRLWYLPFPFDGIIIGINYTHLASSAIYPWFDNRSNYNVRPPITQVFDSTRSGRLIDQPNDILNASFGYDYKGFSGRLSFLFQGNSVSYVGNFPEQDGYSKDYFRIDASARQMLPWPGLEIYIDVNNLNNQNNISVQQSIGGFTNEQNYGLTADFGIRYRL
jgi:TonB-dependent receptor